MKETAGTTGTTGGTGITGATDPQTILREGCAAIGVSLSPAQLGALERYTALLRAGKAEVSLTTLTDPVAIAVKHFLDSLAVLVVLPPGPLRLVDVGTGAGFPGLPLKIARPGLEVVLIEATGKKAAWVQRTIETLGLEGARAVTGRAEELARAPSYRGRFDVATARAVAPLAVLLELCLPFVRPGGRFVALKTHAGLDAELPKAHRALEVLGGRVREVRPVEVPQLPNRVLVVVDLERPVPEQYPRRPGVPAKRPL